MKVKLGKLIWYLLNLSSISDDFAWNWNCLWTKTKVFLVFFWLRAVLYSWNFCFLLNQIRKIARSRHVNILCSSQPGSNPHFLFGKPKERIPTSINAPATPDPQNLISLQLKVFSVREEMLSVTNQTVRTLQRDNSNKFDSQQSEGSGQASWHHMIISQNFPRTEMDFHQTNWHFKHVDAQNLQGQTKITFRKTLYSVSVVARRQPPLQ